MQLKEEEEKEEKNKKIKKTKKILKGENSVRKLANGQVHGIGEIYGSPRTRPKEDVEPRSYKSLHERHPSNKPNTLSPTPQAQSCSLYTRQQPLWEAKGKGVGLWRPAIMYTMPNVDPLSRLPSPRKNTS